MRMNVYFSHQYKARYKIIKHVTVIENRRDVQKICVWLTLTLLLTETRPLKIALSITNT